MKEKDKMNKKLRFILFVFVLVAAALIFRFSPLAQFISRESILAFLEAIRQEWWGPLAFILIMASVV